MNFDLNINSQLWASHLQGPILQAEGLYVVVVEVAPPLHQFVILHLAIKGILEDRGVVMTHLFPLHVIISSARFAKRQDIQP